MKKCKRCQIDKDLSNFRISKRGNQSWTYNICKECTNLQWKQNYYKNHELSKQLGRSKTRYFNYGITEQEYQELLIQQNHSCAICGSKVAGGRGDWHVDHNHTTGRIRGLLCHHCNTGLGLFKDSVDLLQLAAGYLHEHS